MTGGWPHPLTRTVGTQIRHHRKLKGWTAERLAETMTTAGLPYTRAMVTNLETGRRETLTVGEWLLLAHVLDVPPLHLLAPATQVEGIHVLPDTLAPPTAATRWITGDSRSRTSCGPASSSTVTSACCD